MSVPFEEGHSVWTTNDDPEWVARNHTNALLLVTGLSLGSARTLCTRLLLVAPDREFTIKDIRDNEVTRVSAREPLASSAPKRRALGKR